MTVQGIAASDFRGLNDLKTLAKKDSQQALPEVAKQFEAIFLQSMLKSMRMGQQFLDENSPFKGQNQETFQDMLDSQYASNIASTKGIGLAEMLSKQMALNNTAEAQKEPLNQSLVGKAANTQGIALKSSGNTSHNVDDFVKNLWPKAKQAASMMGLDPKILIAQAALETGWGKFIAKDTDGSSSNNLFNIKSGQSKDQESVTVQTTEYLADTPIKTKASFRKYDSLEQSFNDYVSLITGSDRYQSALANAQNPDEYVHALHKAGYATDPEYGSKILAIYHGTELNQAVERCGLSESI